VPDHRGIPPFLAGGPVYLTPLTLETTEPNMTVGQQYDLWGLIIDDAPTGGGPPKPQALVVGDDRHFKLCDLGKLRLEPPPTNPPAP
jgi:hypothetical protein